jgi:hypothetical protein
MMSSPQIEPHNERIIRLTLANQYLPNDLAINNFPTKPLSDFPPRYIERFMQVWGKENFLSWNNALDIDLMSKWGDVLNLANKASHVGIHTQTDPHFDLDKRFCSLDEPKLSMITENVYKAIGHEEGTRRLEALASFLSRYWVSQRWKALKEELCKSGFVALIPAHSFEIIYGLSVEPRYITEIPFETNALIKLWVRMWKYDPVDQLNKIYGDNNEVQKKIQIVKFLDEIPHATNQWWKLYEVEEKSRIYGFDILKVLKVGEALQLGSDSFVVDHPGRMTPEKAYSTILEIIGDSKPLTWMESPERYFLFTLPHSLYPKRLRELSQFIFSKRLSNKPDPKLTSGCELIWVDLGLDTHQMPNVADLRKTLDLEKYLNKYRKISGPFADYSKMAIYFWFRSLFF